MPRTGSWGADCNHAEGIYGATEFTRRCLAEVLAERIEPRRAARRPRETDRQTDPSRQRPLLFPPKDRLWKDKGALLKP